MDDKRLAPSGAASGCGADQHLNKQTTTTRQPKAKEWLTNLPFPAHALRPVVVPGQVLRESVYSREIAPKPSCGLDAVHPVLGSRSEREKRSVPTPAAASAEASLSAPLAAAAKAPAGAAPHAPVIPRSVTTLSTVMERAPARRKRQRYATGDPERMKAGGLIDTQAAAEWLGLAPSTLRNLRCKGGGPPAIKIGRSIRYDPAELDKWLSARSVNSTSQRGGND